MKSITILGRNFTVQEKESEKDLINIKNDKIIIESSEKTAENLLKEYLTELLYKKLYNIYDQTRKEGKIEVLGNLDIEILEKIDNKKNRIAKIKGNKIQIKLNAVVLPEEALKYLIAHEIAHTFTKIHTKRFRSIVKKIYPDYLIGQSLLTKNRNLLTNSFKRTL